MYRLLSIFSMLLAASNMAAHSNSALTTDTTHIQTAIVQTADESALITDTPCDTCCDNVGCTYWIKQIINNGFHIHDPAICYPKFPRFCLEVYNWGDRTFNSYDNNYVVGKELETAREKLQLDGDINDVLSQIRGKHALRSL